MTGLIEWKEKRIYKRSEKRKNEYYNACLDSSGYIPGLLALKVSGLSETLVYLWDGQELCLSANGYILDPCFVGEYAIWSEKTEKGWKVHGVKFANGIPDQWFVAVNTEGRARGFYTIRRKDANILIWEERQGKRTKIRACIVDNNGFNKTWDITDGSYNAYDPAGVETDDGICIAFVGFYLGDYRAMYLWIDKDNLNVGEPCILSSNLGSVLYVSVDRRSAGGLWYAYTQVECKNNESYIQHPLARSQHSFKNQNLPTRLYAGFLIDEQTYTINDHHCVHTGSGAGPSHIMEDAQGTPMVLLRQYARDLSRIAVNDNLYSAADPELNGVDPVTFCTHAKYNNYYPNICLIKFHDGNWSQVMDIVPRAHFECPVSYHFDGSLLTVAYTQDNRHTGWGIQGEWFDEGGELGVGKASVRILKGQSESYNTVQVYLPSCPGNKVEENSVPAIRGTYIQALGQTHAHSNISVCMRMGDRTPHSNYRFIQDVQHSDFGAVTDHDYNMWATEELWMRKLAEYYYFPGEFVSFPAYEWTGSGARHEGGPFGHVNPLWLEEYGNMPVCCAVDEKNEGCSLYKLWKVYKGCKVITPPHHPADKQHYYRWCYFDTEFTPVVEIFQDYRGSGEQPGTAGVTNYSHSMDSWVLNGLRQGLRFGFIAGADHAGIARAGVLVKELTRSGLYEAFIARRTFATTNQTLRLEFTGNGEWMGSAVEADQVKFYMHVTSCEPVLQVEIVRNGETVKTVHAGKNITSYCWDAKREESGEFWFLRIIFTNGEVAWSSPIWID